MTSPLRSPRPDGAERELVNPRVLSKSEWPPDYNAVWYWRFEMLKRYAENDFLLAGALGYYADNPIEFICHWLDTYDPRNAMGEKPTRLPFVMFERQAECIQWLMDCLTQERNGLIDKSREVGATWIAVGFSIWLWRFRPGAAVGWGSRKVEYVDKLGDPKTVFEKIRQGIRGLPSLFWPRGFHPDEHMMFLRIINPENEATITGEGGDEIGRGARTSIYFKDESAHYEHAESIEAALMETTRVQIDMSTPAGIGTVFDNKKEAAREWSPGCVIERGTVSRFTFDWTDHPEKTQEWYDAKVKEKRSQGLLHLVRQEIDRDPAGALQGVIIPPEWVRAAVDAHLALEFDDGGPWMGGLDVFDGGGDSHAFVVRKGVVLRLAEDWGEGDTGDATRRAIQLTDGRRPITIQYDVVGVGAGVKSEVNRLSRPLPDGRLQLPPGLGFVAWDAGAAVVGPKMRVVPNDATTPLNEDFYANLKAQGWWQLRLRCERVYRMRNEPGVRFPVADLISLDSRIPRLRQLMRELSQPVMKKTSGDLKLVVDKAPEGAKSPNLGDATMMCFFPAKMPFLVPPSAMASVGVKLSRRERPRSDE